MAKRGNSKAATAGGNLGGAEGPPAATRSRLLGVRAYARARGVSHTAVQKAIKAGRLAKSVQRRGARTLIDEELANREWADATNPAQQRENHRQAAERELAPASAGQGNLFGLAENDPRGEPEERLTHARAQAARTALQAQLLRLDLDERRGRLVDREQVGSEVLAVTTHVRNEIMALPDRISAVLVGQPVEVIRTRLDEELRKALQRLAELLANHGPQDGDTPR